MDELSLNLRGATNGATNGTIGPQAGDATVVQDVILPYMEQDNIYKMTDITDGTSNTMMVATKAGGEVVSDLLVHESAVPQGIIAILIGLAADRSGTGVHGAARSAAPLDIWEHASLDRAGPATNGIIAVLIGLAVDPESAREGTNNFALLDIWEHAYGFQNVPVTKGILIGLLVPEAVGGPIDSSTLAPVVDPADPKVLYGVGSNGFLETNTTLAGQPLLATTYGRGAFASQITHDVEFEQWASASPVGRGYLSVDLTDVLVSFIRESHANDRIGPADGGTQVVGTDHAWGSHIESILHEDNEFYFPRM
jgi:hypothetical protein